MFLQVLGHFGQGHFGLGRFGPDILATDILATENAKGGRFGHNHKFWVWNVCIHKCVMHYLIFWNQINIWILTVDSKMHDNRGMLFFIETVKLWCILYSSKWYIPIYIKYPLPELVYIFCLQRFSWIFESTDHKNRWMFTTSMLNLGLFFSSKHCRSRSASSLPDLDHTVFISACKYMQFNNWYKFGRNKMYSI